jgi:hypothetical protein
VIAEVEFPSLEAALSFHPPSWFGGKKGKVHELTGVKKYSSRSLASHGWPTN